MLHVEIYDMTNLKDDEIFLTPIEIVRYRRKNRIDSRIIKDIKERLVINANFTNKSKLLAEVRYNDENIFHLGLRESLFIINAQHIRRMRYLECC